MAIILKLGFDKRGYVLRLLNPGVAITQNGHRPGGQRSIGEFAQRLLRRP